MCARFLRAWTSFRMSVTATAIRAHCKGVKESTWIMVDGSDEASKTGAGRKLSIEDGGSEVA